MTAESEIWLIHTQGFALCSCALLAWMQQLTVTEHRTAFRMNNEKHTQFSQKACPKPRAQNWTL
jgi:hypothetical protein